MTRLGYVIIYVPSVPEAVRFYEAAFELEPGFVHEAGDYGEMKTGATRLAFTSHALAADAVPFRYRKAEDDALPLGMELTLTVDDVDASYAAAVAAGAKGVAEPHDTPWGQRVSYVADLNNVIVGIASVIAA